MDTTNCGSILVALRAFLAQYNLAVTVQHDGESTSSASRFDVYQPQHPYVSLDEYINGAHAVSAAAVVASSRKITWPADPAISTCLRSRACASIFVTLQRVPMS
jgi:hypothetical protein